MKALTLIKPLVIDSSVTRGSLIHGFNKLSMRQLSSGAEVESKPTGGGGQDHTTLGLERIPKEAGDDGIRAALGKLRLERIPKEAGDDGIRAAIDKLRALSAKFYRDQELIISDIESKLISASVSSRDQELIVSDIESELISASASSSGGSMLSLSLPCAARGGQDIKPKPTKIEYEGEVFGMWSEFMPGYPKTEDKLFSGRKKITVERYEKEVEKRRGKNWHHARIIKLTPEMKKVRPDLLTAKWNLEKGGK